MKMNRELWILGLMVMLLWWPRPTTTSNSHCQEKCGDVSVPYPFGIDNPKCAMDDHFLLECNHSQLMFGNIVVLNISVEEGTIMFSIPASRRCFDESGVLGKHYDWSIALGDGPFRFSDTRNKLTVFGCDTLAVLSDFEGNLATACGSLCSYDEYQSMNITGDSCSGIGCCQTPLPKSLKALDISLDSVNDHMNDSRGINPCDYVFPADESVNISALWKDTLDPSKNVTSNVTIEWVVKEEECDKARLNASSYACGQNANCHYSENGKGYRCLCNEGFEGNPYNKSSGCQDIDECKQPHKYKCDGTCKNTEGNYTCSCPFGMRDDGKLGCQGFRITTIIAVGVGLLFAIPGALWSYKVFQRRRIIKIKEKFFKRNGGLLFQQKMLSNEGSTMEKTKLFTSIELETATNTYSVDRVLGQGGQGTMYKGMLADGRIVAIKISKMIDEGQIEQFIKEVVILSQIDHRNVVKLLGYCLETEVLILVYEFIPNGTLSHVIHDQTEEFPMPWEIRLRVAIEVASAISYLHSAASVPIYHRDIKSSNILLDEKFRAKLSDFGISKSIALDQSHLTTQVKGTFGYFDPEYFQSSHFTEKSDVYSFGVVLTELLTGRKPICSVGLEEKIGLAAYFLSSLEENNLTNIVDAQVSKEDRIEEVMKVALLAKRCLNLNGRSRPSMREVVTELEGIMISKGYPFGHQNQPKIQVKQSTENWDSSLTSSGATYSEMNKPALEMDVKPLLFNTM